jgi:hypothetical protein
LHEVFELPSCGVYNVRVHEGGVEECLELQPGRE